MNKDFIEEKIGELDEILSSSDRDNYFEWESKLKELFRSTLLEQKQDFLKKLPKELLPQGKNWAIDIPREEIYNSVLQEIKKLLEE